MNLNPLKQMISTSSEENFYDTVGRHLLDRKDDLTVDQPAYFLSGSMDAFKYMLERIGPIEGKRVLDYGCGSGWLGVFLAKQGALVEGFDISGRLVDVATIRAHENGVAHLCNFRKMMAENLDYPDSCFDIVVGISILHHVELQTTTYHLKRVMKKGATAIFIEPLGENRILEWARRRVFNVHHDLKKDKRAEAPLTYPNIHSFGRDFDEYHWHEFQFLSMARRFIGDDMTEAMHLHKLDDWLLAKLPWLKRLCRLVVIECIKK